MTNHYKVAGHIFSIELPDDSPMWQHLGNYSPFRTEPAETLFALTLAPSVNEDDASPYYNDRPEEPDMPVIDLLQTPDGWLFKMRTGTGRPLSGLLRTDRSFSHGTLAVLGPIQSQLFAVNNAAMLMFAFASAPFDTLEMHASVIVNDGRGYLFLGKSGTGKSTHSSLWLKHIEGSRLLNDDNPVVRISEDGTPYVYGSPWSGKTPCYINDSVPIGALVRINQYPENRIRQYGIVDSYASVYTSCSGLRFDRAMADALHSTLEKLVLTVPGYLLDCLPDADAARLCHNTVSNG